MKRTVRNTYLCEVTEGLEFVTERELKNVGAQITERSTGEIAFRFDGELSKLLSMKTAQSVSSVQPFPVPRPRGLLSHEFLPRIVEQIDAVRRLFPRDTFRTFFLAAAGSETAVMGRIKEAIAAQTRLTLADDRVRAADLWLRIRPNRVGEWEVIVRLTPRPLVTRQWRVCNMEGALNAATAHAMVLLTNPQPQDVFVNLGYGSATLLIERLAAGACAQALGMDHDKDNLHCAHANIDASGYAGKIRLVLGDMAHLPLPTASVDALCADLPFGQLTGTHLENERLYPRMIAESARIARKGARFALITHEVKLMEATMRSSAEWSLEQTIRINLRGLHPRIYLLRRR